MLLPKEIWKDIEGYEGKYQVSNIGNVRSLDYRHTGKIKRLKLNTDKSGYSRLRLYKEGKPEDYLVYRLVAQAFIPNPNNLPCVNHKDENPRNNCVWNLEWCTYSYNNNYGTRNEKASKAMKGNTWNKGRVFSEEHRRKISEAKKEYYRNRKGE